MRLKVTWLTQTTGNISSEQLHRAQTTCMHTSKRRPCWTTNQRLPLLFDERLTPLIGWRGQAQRAATLNGFSPYCTAVMHTHPQLSLVHGWVSSTVMERNHNQEERSELYAGFSTAFKSFATEAIHVGQEPEQWKSMAVVPPISLSTTFKQSAPGNHAVSSLIWLGGGWRGVRPAGMHVREADGQGHARGLQWAIN